MPTKKTPRRGGGVTTRHMERRKSKDEKKKKKKKKKKKEKEEVNDIWKDPDFQRIKRSVRERYQRKKYIRNVFRFCDQNKDGEIDSKELYDLFDMMGTGVTRDMSNKIHSLFDYDQNGKIKYAEFLDLLFDDEKSNKKKRSGSRESDNEGDKKKKNEEEIKDEKTKEPIKKRTDEEKMQLVKDVLGILRSRYSAKRSLQKVFKLWDMNRDGQISFEEMSEVFNFLGLTNLSEDDVRTIHEACLSKENGTLQYHNFVNMVFNEEENSETKSSQVAIIRSKTFKDSDHEESKHSDINDDVITTIDVVNERSTHERLREGFVIQSPKKPRERPCRKRRESPVSTSSKLSVSSRFDPPEQNLKVARESLLQAICDKARGVANKAQDFEKMFQTVDEMKVLKLNTFRGSLRDLGIGTSRMFFCIFF
jgi:Ca2+-binding EF-hand superfamily protein